MKRISDYTLRFDEILTRYYQELDHNPENLYAPITYGLSAGGKRLRPALLLLTADAFGGEPAMEKAASAALGIEMFHNFTLLHDDVMDNSDTRRGRPTVHAKWDSNVAILSGDTMLTLSTILMTDVEDQKLRRVLEVFNRMAIEVYEGQRYDMDFETEEKITIDDYINMIRLKTGALLGASAEIGALIAGASEKDCMAIKEYGNLLGIAFQIQDDWLDTFGDPATFGKPIGGDILNGKKTFLTVMAMSEESSKSEAFKAAMELSGEIKIKTVTRLYQSMGIDKLCTKFIAEYSNKAMKAINSTSLSDESKEIYRMLTDKLTGRKI